MLEAPHVAVGVAIATKIGNPLIAIPLAFVSHFVLDMTPHWNPHLNTELKKYGKVTKKSKTIIIVDVLAALSLGSYFAYLALPNTDTAIVILLASFASVLPDVIEAPHFFLGLRNKFITKWISIQKAIQNDTNVYFGTLTQIVTIIAAIYWILN